MKTRGQKDSKRTIQKARKLASKGKSDKAAELFGCVINDYMQAGLTLKALGTAKMASKTLGNNPAIRARIIRMYTSMGLNADASAEYNRCSDLLNKDKIELFEGLGEEEFLDFLDIIEIVETGRSQHILREGEKGEDIFIVVSGNFEVTRKGNDLPPLGPGDIFGEMGYYHNAERSASVRSTGTGTLIRIPPEPLRGLCRRYPGVNLALENLYTKRVLKKATEELDGTSPVIEETSRIIFRKGEEILMGNCISVVKHGVVEINYDDKGLNKKKFLGPGCIFRPRSGSAKANTDVELIRTKLDGPG